MGGFGPKIDVSHHFLFEGFPNPSCVILLFMLLQFVPRRCSPSHRYCIHKHLFCDGKINCALKTSSPVDEKSCAVTAAPKIEPSFWGDAGVLHYTGVYWDMLSKTYGVNSLFFYWCFRSLLLFVTILDQLGKAVWPPTSLPPADRDPQASCSSCWVYWSPPSTPSGDCTPAGAGSRRTRTGDIKANLF